MSERSTWDLGGPAVGDAYALLLRAVAPLATGVAMIVRSPSVTLSEHATLVMEQLTPYLLGVDETQEWPGTRLVSNRTSTRYTYKLNPESLEVLLSAASGLFEWINPALPEDLHFLRGDGSTVLGSVAQEGDAWLELDDAEASELVRVLPAELRMRRG